MCGGISASLARAAASRGRAQLLYNAGRITSYALAGALAGQFGVSLFSLLGQSGALALRVLAGLFLIAAGLYLSKWWMGMAQLERLGSRAWRRIAPLVRSVGAPDRYWKWLALGAIWGWLPCGLVYAALAGAVAAGSALQGGLWMVCFGIGTLPAMLAGGALSGALLGFSRRARTRRAAGALLVGFGIWTVAAAVLWEHPHGGGHAAHARAEHAHEP
jgi:hypothetical protein